MTTVSLQEIFARSTELRADLDHTLSSLSGSLSISSQQRLAVQISELENILADMKALPKPSPVWTGRQQRLEEDLRDIKRTIDKLIGQRAREELLGKSRLADKAQDERASLLRERGHLDSATVALDNLIAQGKSMFSGIRSQNEMIKSGNKKLLDVLNKAGVNVRLVQRIVGRERVDSLIVYVGMVITLLLFFALWFFFR